MSAASSPAGSVNAPPSADRQTLFCTTGTCRRSWFKKENQGAASPLPVSSSSAAPRKQAESRPSGPRSSAFTAFSQSRTYDAASLAQTT